MKLMKRKSRKNEEQGGSQHPYAHTVEEAVTPDKPTNKWTFALNTGLFAGIIWGGIRIFEYYFNFTNVHPTFLIRPWSSPIFNQTNLGYMTGWGAFILLSIIASLVYMICFRKIRGPWPGMLYGLAWWVVLYALVGPLIGMMKSINMLGWTTIITDVCLFILWGFFIGNSIEYEFTDEQQREPQLSPG